jgi:hypothetical protein
MCGVLAYWFEVSKIEGQIFTQNQTVPNDRMIQIAADTKTRT